MIATELARVLRDSGLVWRPESGDTFRIDRPEADSDIFTVSEMTVEPHHFPTGTTLGFNGTTEWALDSVEIGETLWLPREDQLRELLGGTFRSLVRDTADGPDTVYIVSIEVGGGEAEFTGTDAADAYGRALLSMMDLTVTPEVSAELDDLESL